MRMLKQGTGSIAFWLVTGLTLSFGVDGAFAQAPEPPAEEEQSGPPTEAEQQAQEEEAYLLEEEEVCKPVDYDELKLLDALRKRHQVLTEKEVELEQKEALLRVIEEELDTKFRSLTGQLNRLEEKLTLGEAEMRNQEKRFKKLVEALTTLSPRKAAPILAQAEQQFATRLLLQVAPERIGKLLAQMEPKEAARLMVRLDRSRNRAQRAAAKGRQDWDIAKSKKGRRGR